MKIKAIKVDYRIEAAPGLRIFFTTGHRNTDEETEAFYHFDTEPEKRDLRGILRVEDECHQETLMWEKEVDFSKKLTYGLLDELIENTIFQYTKGMGQDTEGMIGGYRADDPAVVWMCRRETFLKVVKGWAIHDRKFFSAEILAETENGDDAKVIFGEDQKASLYVQGKLKSEDHIHFPKYADMTLQDALNKLEDSDC
ncbi:MAG: hypothetical protein K5770_20290 [Lachnospiraceae bacterium]|nr:hypothetical protein [Lachnospiraceae bacterium]